MPDDLHPSEPLVLLVGTLNTEGVLSHLKATGRQYKLKRLDSTPDNWAAIADYFDQFRVQCVIVKANPSAYHHLSNPDYHSIRDRLVSGILSVPHMVLVHDALLSNIDEATNVADTIADTVEEGGEAENEDLFFTSLFHDVPAETRRFVNTYLSTSGLNVIPYTTNAELAVIASTFIADTTQGLLFRIYVPATRLWANETGTLLELFRDYLTRVGRMEVRLDQHRTQHGSIYEFFRIDLEPENNLPSFAEEFREFSHLMDLCINNPADAETLLRSKHVDPQQIIPILKRYAKEGRRLQVDLRQEREEKLLSIRHRLESELIDIVPAEVSTDVIRGIVEASIPFADNVATPISQEFPLLEITGGAGSSITVNYRSTVVEAVNSIVAEEVNGDISLSKEDRELLELVLSHGDSQVAELASAIRELADDSAPEKGRLVARQRLKAFLLKVAGKSGDIAVALLQKYLENRMGLP